jgi:argininosuccinate lyase
MSRKELWSGRFRKQLDPLAKRFASSPEDAKIVKHDILGSIAHAMALERAGILSGGEKDEIVSGLRTVYQEFLRDGSKFLAGEEDIHMAVERRLTDLCSSGLKLHTGRSRNDQIATDLRLFARDASLGVCGLLLDIQKTLLSVARREASTVMPGYTHLQHAQPVYFSHFLLAHFESFRRDFDRIVSDHRRNSVSPLGAGAISGTTHGIDTGFTSSLLGFSEPFRNSIDATSDRDFVLDALYANALVAEHLSSMAEEMILWSTSEFSFIELPDDFSTGSSIMPHKKNPDIAEHIRGRSSHVIANLVDVMLIVNSLPLGYASDMQHVKMPLFESFESVSSMLSVAAPLLTAIRPRRERMAAAAADEFSYSVEVVDSLVRSGMPFRQAHEAVGRCILESVEQGTDLRSSLRRNGISADVPGNPAESVELRKTRGASSLKSVREQMAAASAAIAAGRKWLNYELARKGQIEKMLLGPIA